MKHVPFLSLCLTAGLAVSSSVWILNKPLNCSQLGLDHCRISEYLLKSFVFCYGTLQLVELFVHGLHAHTFQQWWKTHSDYCSDKPLAVSRPSVPTSPELGHMGYEHLGVGMDKHGLVPVVSVTWKLKSDASLLYLSGSEINILDESTNQSLCVRYSFRIYQQLNPSGKQWTLSLDGVVVEPGHTYMLSVFNLPEPESRDTEIIRRTFTIPGCNDKKIQMAQVCRQNGSLWVPNITTAVFVDRERKRLSIVVTFETAQYSERYQVSLTQGQIFHRSEKVFKDNRTSLNVTLEFGLWEVSQCELLLTIQPFFERCKNGCWCPKTIINYCNYYPPRTLIIKATMVLLVINGFLVYLLWGTVHKAPVNTSSSAAKEQPEGFQVQERKRVLIIYSLDHPLYRNIVLKFCAFLITKCGTEVVLDLLDSTRLGVLGSIQWLDWHREQMESSSDKILILCSPGVQAKWKAMCGDKPFFLREDSRSPLGDMLTPALSLMVPHFIRSATFEKYIVAYFDGVCSEDDVPSPFNITVRYKIMKQFEELFFRILDTEKHRPGQMNCVNGLSEDDYHQCPSGRALRDAIEAFQAYQQQHPHWFEDELLEGTDMEVEDTFDEIDGNTETSTDLIAYSIPDSTHVIGLVKTKESDFTAEKSALYTEQLQMRASV